MPLRRYTGTLIKFNHGRGFGWVKVDAPLPEAYVHIRDFPNHVGVHMLGSGVKIEFYLEQRARGLHAVRANIV
ncbi:Cold shock protein, CspA family [Bradyrhizobium erythrophlei]|nr:Cold shock protein, CspA family [Bradyrhizobium erythrophlei]